MSMVLRTSPKSTAALTVVVAALVPPVIVSEAEKVPLGMVIAKVVELGLLVIDAVAALVPPVIVSAIEKEPESPTVIVKVPPGYSVMPVAKGIVVCSIVH
tara:strand:+ start:163 stop:462 length:300 start_codon:yes stop_codon:yes gene_type:complete